MATFSRGLCLSGLRPLLLPRAVVPELAATRSRLFTTCLRLQAAPKPAVKVTTSKPLPKTSTLSSSSTTGIAPSRYAFMKSLATKSSPTILYEGPSHFWFYFGCWTSGVFILTWTLLTGPSMIRQPEGIPQWVGVVYGASYVLLGSMGFYLITKTPNIVGAIRVIPAKLAAGTGAAAAGPAPLQMEVTVKRMLPFMQPKVLTTNLENVTLKSRFSLPDEYVPELRRLEAQRAEDARRSALREFDMNHLLTMPFRQLGRVFSNMFSGVKSAWTDMGYGIIEVDGKKYKVDVTKGFAHDGFRTLEKLVIIKP